ncbi:MAG: phosphoesterase [Acidimicrobiia bacterium]
MRWLVLSDIHGNIDALDAVLADAEGHWDRVLCLGDLVGYGAAPSAVIARIRSLGPLLLRGNHDRVAAGLSGATDFSPLARTAIEWTRSALSPEERTWLASMPVGPVTHDSGAVLCHGAPFDEDYYVVDLADARMTFLREPFRVCLHGHTHLQTCFTMEGRAVIDRTPFRRARHAVHLRTEHRWLINPGSVGQPRDGDPRAAYASWDAEAGVVELRRVDYDIAAAQGRMRAAGLPERLAERLEIGD